MYPDTIPAKAFVMDTRQLPIKKHTESVFRYGRQKIKILCGDRSTDKAAFPQKISYFISPFLSRQHISRNRLSHLLRAPINTGKLPPHTVPAGMRKKTFCCRIPVFLPYIPPVFPAFRFHS